METSRKLNFYTGNELFRRMREGQRPWPGGRQIIKSTVVSGRTAGGSYSGFDTFITTQEDVRQLLKADPCQYYWDLTLSGIQLAVNKGQEAFVDLLTAEFEDVTRAMGDKMGTDLYGDGTGNASKAINGLVYHIDDATNVATYENLARGTYTTLKSTITSQSGAISLANLRTDWDTAQVGRDMPTLIVTTPTVFSLLEALHTMTVFGNYGGIVRPTGAPTGIPGQGINVSFGANTLTYRGAPILADEKCTSGNLYFLNENHLWLYTIEHSPETTQGSKDGFAWTGWKKSVNQDAIVGQILFAGQLFGDSPRTMTRRYAVTT